MSARYKLTKSPEGILTAKEAWLDELEKPEKVEREREKEIQEYTRRLAELSARRLAEIAALKAQARRLGEHAMRLQEAQEEVERQAKEASRVIEEQFVSLAQQWRMETGFHSSPSAKFLHPAYLEIIGMGKSVIPFLLGEVKKLSGNWFLALRAITRQDPVAPEDAESVRTMAEAWLRWGKNNGYEV